VASDGSTAACTVETGWRCVTPPDKSTSCAPVCGDGIRVGDEACDDQNTQSGDGCASDCTVVEEGYECKLTAGAGMLGSAADVCKRVQERPVDSSPKKEPADELANLDASDPDEEFEGAELTPDPIALL